MDPYELNICFCQIENAHESFQGKDMQNQEKM